MPILTATSDTDGIRKYGPVFPVIVAAAADAAAATSQSQFALVDTGADQSCIDIQTAEAAGWPVIDSARLSSVTHPDQTVPVFSGSLLSAEFQASIEVPRWFGVNLGGHPVVALIGRDILAHAVFIYNGQGKSFTLAI